MDNGQWIIENELELKKLAFHSQLSIINYQLFHSIAV